MEDPWATNPSASGAGWDAKTIESTNRLPGEESRHTPPATFDVGDPWGVAATPSLPAPTAHTRTPVSPTRNESILVPASASGWEDSNQPWGSSPIPAIDSINSPTPVSAPSSPQGEVTTKEEQSHDAVWSLDSPTQQISALPAGSSPSILGSEIPLPISPGPSTPPPSFAAFGPTSLTPQSIKNIASAQASPVSFHSTHSDYHDEGGFGSPSSNLASLPMSLPKSPSFGDDFGGFAAGPSFANDPVSDTDPWGTGTGSGGGVGGSTSTEVPMPTWGPAGGDDQDDWAGDMSFGDSNAKVDQRPTFIERDDEDINKEDEEGGWGLSRAPHQSMPIAGNSGGDDEWEEAQRRIRIKLERAPQERIDTLISAWTELGKDVGVKGIELLEKTGAEEMKFEEEVKRVQDDVYEKLRSLSMIPPDINTYPPVISSLVTHERYSYALTRPNPTPSTSFLTTAARRPRRFDIPDTTLTSTSDTPSWTNRSRLGEPDVDASGAATAAAAGNQPVEENKSRWSFWRKPTLERQLTTSGGGILEVKQTPISPSLSNNGVASGSRASASTSTDNKPGSIPIAPSSSRPASIISRPSRPASPAPAILSPSLSLPSIPQDTVGHSAPSGQIPQQTSTAPSAVSRFFGRLSRKPSTAAQMEEDIDGKDIELTADDFSYLAEVPSITSPPIGQGVEDLLSLEGPTLPAKTLDNVLKYNAPLPKPLAPPPATRSVSGGKFVAKMKAPPPTDFDLLGDLDFASSSSSTNPKPNLLNGTNMSTAQNQNPTATISTSAWDDFLAFDSSTPPSQPSQPAPTPVPQVPQPQPTSPFSHIGGGTPTLSLSPPPTQSSSTFPTFHTSLSPITQQQHQHQQQSSAVPANPTLINDSSGSEPRLGDDPDTGFDDFGFGTPQNGSMAQMSSFDDFGDFSVFEQNSQPQVAVADIPKPRPLSAFVQSSQPSYATPTSKQQKKFETPGTGTGLDHTPTLTLLTNASASKGRRWPAPPSPGAPILEPPPKVDSYPTPTKDEGGFPFLSPPPGGSFRPVSKSRNLLDDGDSNQEGTTIISPPPSSASTSPFGGALAPNRSLATPPPPSPPRQQQQQQQPSFNTGGGGGGLSAQDLSFFDSL